MRSHSSRECGEGLLLYCSGFCFRRKCAQTSPRPAMPMEHPPHVLMPGIPFPLSFCTFPNKRPHEAHFSIHLRAASIGALTRRRGNRGLTSGRTPALRCQQPRGVFSDSTAAPQNTLWGGSMQCPGGGGRTPHQEASCAPYRYIGRHCHTGALPSDEKGLVVRTASQKSGGDQGSAYARMGDCSRRQRLGRSEGSASGECSCSGRTGVRRGSYGTVPRAAWQKLFALSTR